MKLDNLIDIFSSKTKIILDKNYIVQKANEFISKNGKDKFISNFDITNQLKEETIKDILENNNKVNINVSNRIGVISHLKQIGNGSDRKVYQLSDDLVIKIAKNERGITQNETEKDISDIQSNQKEKVSTNVYEIGLDYVICENIQQYKTDKDTDRKIRAFIKPFKEISNFGFETYQKDEVKEVLKSYNLDYLIDTNLLWGDFVLPRNWGINKENKVLHLDGGTFNSDILDLTNNPRKTIKRSERELKSIEKSIKETILNDFNFNNQLIQQTNKISIN